MAASARNRANSIDFDGVDDLSQFSGRANHSSARGSDVVSHLRVTSSPTSVGRRMTAGSGLTLDCPIVKLGPSMHLTHSISWKDRQQPWKRAVLAGNDEACRRGCGQPLRHIDSDLCCALGNRLHQHALNDLGPGTFSARF